MPAVMAPAMSRNTLSSATLLFSRSIALLSRHDPTASHRARGPRGAPRAARARAPRCAPGRCSGRQALGAMVHLRAEARGDAGLYLGTARRTRGGTHAAFRRARALEGRN